MLEDTGLRCCLAAFRSAGVASWWLPKGELAAKRMQAMDRVGGRGETFLPGYNQKETLGRCWLLPAFLPSFYSWSVSCVMVSGSRALVKRPHRRSLALCSAAKLIGHNYSPLYLRSLPFGCSTVYIYCLSGRSRLAVNRYQFAGSSSGSKITTCSPGLYRLKWLIQESDITPSLFSPIFSFTSSI